jgi:hypothetical protein
MFEGNALDLSHVTSVHFLYKNILHIVIDCQQIVVLMNTSI